MNQESTDVNSTSYQQAVGNVSIQGSDNPFNIVQGNVVNLTINDRISCDGIQIARGFQKPISQQEYRQDQILQNKIQEYWIKGVLKKSLYVRALIELGLEERIDTIIRPFRNEEFPQETQRSLPQGTDITKVFNQMGEGRTLLILGEPGSGKTITLLKLAQDLLAKKQEDPNSRTPVVFNLSSWATKQLPIAKWLVEELYEKYQVSKSLGKTWIKEQQLILLLDGLDEVKPESRNACVQALNQFTQSYGLTELTICCRISDYEVLSQKLALRSAICIQPLTPGQVDRYLEQAGYQLTALRTVIQKIPDLQKMAESPLMLSIMSLAYQGYKSAQISQVETTAERKNRLLNTYIDRMFERRGNVQYYPRDQAQKWLIWLAQQMNRTSQTIFFIEGLQLGWIPTPAGRFFYNTIFGLLGGLSGVVTAGLLAWLSKGLSSGFSNELFYVLFTGTILGIFFGVVRESKAEIQTVETLYWSWKGSKQSYKNGFIFGIGITLVLGLLAVLSYFLSKEIIFGWSAIVIAVLVAVLINGLITELIGWLRGPEIQQKGVPNQGVYTSIRNAIVFGLAFGLVTGIICHFVSNIQFAVIFGLCAGLSAGLSAGGRACGRHFTLRLILYGTGFMPWNYSRFLDYAADRLFLQKVGGGYIFIHRMVLEHFANMDLRS